MNVAFQRNIGSFLRALPGLAAVTITAGSGNDAVAQDGITLDRNAFEPLCLSGFLAVNAVAALNEGVDTAEISVSFQDSANGTDWAPYDAGPATNVSKTLDADGTYAIGFKAQFGGARRYVRARVTASLSRADTDTVDLSAMWIVGGADELPIEDYVEPSES